MVFGQKKVTAAADEVVTKPTTAIPNGSEGSDFLTSTTKDDSASLTTSEHRYEWVGLLGHTTAQPYQDFLREPEQPMAWGPSQGYYGRF